MKPRTNSNKARFKEHDVTFLLKLSSWACFDKSDTEDVYRLFGYIFKVNRRHVIECAV